MSKQPVQLAAQAGATRPTTLGVIIGNRDFFPDVLVGEARKDITDEASSSQLRMVQAWAAMYSERAGESVDDDDDHDDDDESVHALSPSQ